MFTDDGGGFAITCSDAKIAFGASTWNTKLSQLGKVDGPVYIMTGDLLDLDYIGRILGKRPRSIWIVAHERARLQAESLLVTFPEINIALHAAVNAKLVLVGPKTVWLSSADFGRPEQKTVESEIGLHSEEIFSRVLNSIFITAWACSQPLGASVNPS